MSRVLWLTPVPPDRSGGGGHIRQAHLFRALAARAEIDLVCSHRVVDPAVNEAAASVRELGTSEWDAEDHSKLVRRLRDLRTAFLATPREVASFGSVRRAMKPFAASARADIVLVEYAGLAPLVEHRTAGQRWILTLHNLGSEMAVQEAAVTDGRRQRWLYQRDAATSRRWEQQIAARYDRVIAVSDLDAMRLAAGGAQNVSVVPNGVDLGRRPAESLPSDPVVVFTGALYTGPNRDGIAWFCREVWPRIRAELPDAKLLVVGSRPGPDVLSLSGVPGVEVLSDVPETRSYLERARVAIVPLRIGSGTRLKALEAMAAGRPVIGTTIGLEGLDLADGLNVVVADEPREFSDAVTRVLVDDGWATSLASEGRKRVEERYGWDSIGERFADTILGKV